MNNIKENKFLEYVEHLNYNILVFVDNHSGCSISPKDFKIVDSQDKKLTFIICNTCEIKQIVGEVTFDEKKKEWRVKK